MCQVSQYTFAMCSYRERKHDPTDILQLDGHTVDFCDPLEGQQSTYLQSAFYWVIISLTVITPFGRIP